jgi:hypothetical protein
MLLLMVRIHLLVCLSTRDISLEESAFLFFRMAHYFLQTISYEFAWFVQQSPSVSSVMLAR